MTNSNVRKIILKFAVLFSILLFGVLLYSQDTIKFKKEVEALVAGDSAINKKDIILFTGSSSIGMWGDLNAFFPNHNIINRGFGGSQMVDLVNYADELIVPYHPKQIFIYEGDNDLGAGKSPDQILEQADKLLSVIRKKLPRRIHVIFISPKPSILRWQLKDKYQDYNHKLESWTKQQKNVAFIDVWTPMLDSNGNLMKDLFLEDGLHMNKKGYDIWAKVIGPYIK